MQTTSPSSPSRLTASRALARHGSRALFLVLMLGVSHMALAYAGENLLNYGANFILAPLGLFAVVILLAGSAFNSQLTKLAVYAAVITVILFTIIKAAPALMTAMSS